MNDEYPTRGVSLIVPPNATLPITGWGIKFERRGHRYHVRYHASGLAIERDEQPIRKWDDLPTAVQAIIVKARNTYGPGLTGVPQ